MKKIFAIILWSLLFSHNTKAQDKRMVCVLVSTNQIELGFQHYIISNKLWTDAYTGLGNQDINSRFDDFTLRLGVGFNAFSNPKNQISLNSGFGVYFPNNDYYSVAVPFVHAGARYARFFGKTEQHSLMVGVGYRHGERNYKQAYYSDMAKISTIGTFQVSPFNVSIGYGFRF